MFYYLMMCLKYTEWVSNNVNPDHTLQNAASNQGLQCVLRPVSLYT